MKLLKRILKRALRFLRDDLPVARVLDLFFPKDNNLFIFGSFRSRFFKDNAAYFFDYVRRSEKQVRAVVFSVDKKIRQELNDKYGPGMAFSPYSLKGLFYALRAGVVVVSYNLTNDFPISFLFSRRKTVLNLWHSILLKGICLTDNEWDNKTVRVYMKLEAKRYDVFIASSKLERLMVSTAFGVPYKNVPVTGSPRDDRLYEQIHNRNTKKRILDYFHDIGFEVKKIILYAPTKREMGAPRLFPFADMDLQQVEDFLEKNESLLLLRSHAANILNAEYGFADFKLFDKFQHIQTLNIDKVEEVTEIVADIDILITDYSGIYLDFLLLDRPIMFIPYDIDEYQAMPGIMLDYNLVTPGPKVGSQKEFLTALQRYIEDPTIDGCKRRYTKSLFHQEFDGKACERIFNCLTARKG